MNSSQIFANIRSIDRRKMLILVVAVAIAISAVVLGYWLIANGGEAVSDSSVCDGEEVLYWYDPMEPDQRFDEPGQSPFMDMELLPRCASEAAGGVTVSPAMTQNLGIRVVAAEMRDIATSVPAIGRVEIDERLITEVQTLTAGFVEYLAVRAEGEPVEGGHRIASVYSPELLTAQHEYRAVLAMPREVAPPSLRSAARSRLTLLGLPDAQIRHLERGGAPQRTYPIHAPTSGVVTRIGARPGAQVQLGQSIVTIADLSRIWVIAEVPEATLGTIRRGLPAEIRFPAYPEDVREGAIDYVFPALDSEARTARVRITLANPGGRLLEGMFANITIQGTGGMALVIPSEAVIDTGRRRVVIVQRDSGFVPVEVRTGRETGEWTQIREGIEAGDEVVTSGQFLIDSEASLSGIIERLSANSAQPTHNHELASATGRVLRINSPQGTVSIEHGPVPTMNWPAMTMTFGIREPNQLRGLSTGDRVQFHFRQRQEGDRYVIEQIDQAAAQ